MTPKITLLGILLCSASLAGNAAAKPPQPAPDCPISLDHLDLRYNHAGGESKPQLKLFFTNRTSKTITGLTLTLSILDNGGNTHPYPNDLTYKLDAAPGTQQRSHTWNLEAASVDMHHAGESVTLEKVQYADGTAWGDDGSLACTLAVDFHAK